jgi:DNA end-binding protein Ku
MEDRGRVGIGTVVMRNKQYLGAIRPLDGALALSTMRFADEVVDKADIDAIPARRSKPEPKELKLASQIVDSLEADWKPERYHDTYTEELQDLIARKDKGEDLVVEEPDEGEGAEVIDLMAALEASIDSAKRARSGGRKRAAKRSSSSAGSSTSTGSSAKASSKGSSSKGSSSKRAAKRSSSKNASGSGSKRRSA